MYCPECGNDAGDAKFCPECGADLTGVKGALGAKGRPAGRETTGQQRREGGGQPAPAARLPPSRPAAGSRPPSSGAPSRSSPSSWSSWSSWPRGGSGRRRRRDDRPASTPATPVSADTSGSYDELVQRANELYDQGEAKFQGQAYRSGRGLLRGGGHGLRRGLEAGQEQRPTWAPTLRPRCSTAATSTALKQIELRDRQVPGLPGAYFNKGNYLAHKGRIAEQDGDAKAADAATAAAKAAYTKAVSIDPSSAIGKAADQQLAGPEVEPARARRASRSVRRGRERGGAARTQRGKAARPAVAA